MNMRGLLTGAVLACVIMLAGSQVFSQESGGGQPGGDMPDMQKMMAEFAKLIEPGPQHKQLDAFVGSWKTTTRMWFMGPEGPASESAGTSEVKWMLGGRYIQEDLESKLMMPGPDGQMQEVPFTGFGMTGYDNYRNLYIGTWADSMSTQMLTMRGMRHPETGVFTFYGEMDEPMLKVVGRTVKYVNRIVNKDKHVFEIYDLHAGDDYKVMEVIYDRVK